MTTAQAMPGTVAPRASRTLLATDHYVLKKLYRDLLPWLIAAHGVNKQWFVKWATIDAYASDIMAALAALGIGAPFIALASGQLPAGTTAIDVLHKALPGLWFIVGVIALLCYVVLRVIVRRENVVGKALFAQDCVHTMKGLTQQLFAALPDADPMPKITQIQKSANDTVANAIKNDVWPYNPLPPLDEIEVELNTMVERIREQFMLGWAPAPVGEQYS